MFFKQTFLPRPLFRMLSNISLQTEIFSAVDVVEAIDTFLNQGKIHPFQRESLRQVGMELKNEKGNQLIVVSGAFFGDEAKGKIVDALLKHPRISGVIRANSGENAGHTLIYNGEEWVFAIMPCGILTPGKKNYIGNEVVMDPVTFVESELHKVENLLGQEEVKNRLMIGNCDVVMPWHKIADLAGEPNTSTGKGMAQVHAAKSSRCSIKLDDVLNGDWGKLEKNMDLAFGEIIGEGKRYKNFTELRDALRPKYSSIPSHIQVFLEKTDPGERMEYVKYYLKNEVEKLNPYRGNVNEEIQKGLKENNIYIVESPQSVFLSNSEGTHPGSSTSAHTHAMGVLASIGVAHERHRHITYNVTKLPSSRVGSGANPAGLVPQNWFSDNGLTIENLQFLDGKIKYEHVHNAFIGLIQGSKRKGSIHKGAKNTIYHDAQGKTITIKLKNGKEHELTIMEAVAIVNCLDLGEFGARTRRPRVIGALDLMHMKHVVNSQGKNFSISRLDAMDGLKEIPLVVGYIYLGEKTLRIHGKEVKNGDTFGLDNSLPPERVLKECEPIYRVVPGYNNSKDLKPGDPIPEDVSRFLQTIEELTGAHILSFGNGRAPENLVHMTRKIVERKLDFETWYSDLERRKNQISGRKEKKLITGTQDILATIYHRVMNMMDAGVTDSNTLGHVIRLGEKLAYRYRGQIDPVYGDGAHKTVVQNILSLRKAS